MTHEGQPMPNRETEQTPENPILEKIGKVVASSISSSSASKLDSEKQTMLSQKMESALLELYTATEGRWNILNILRTTTEDDKPLKIVIKFDDIDNSLLDLGSLAEGNYLDDVKTKSKIIETVFGRSLDMLKTGVESYEENELKRSRKTQFAQPGGNIHLPPMKS